MSHSPPPSKQRRPNQRGSDEATTKNPILCRLSPATPGPWRDAVVEQVRRGRDRFHQLVHRHLGRQYRRPPIYLVDDWVVDALGAFYVWGGPGHSSAAGHETHTSGHEAPPDSSIADPWLSTVMTLFGAVQSLRTCWSRAWLLDLTVEGERLVKTATALTVATVRGVGVAEAHAELERHLERSGQVPLRALFVLKGDANVAPWLRASVRAELSADLERAHAAARRLTRLRPQRRIEQVGIEPGRPGGLLIDGLEQLDIRGPAVVLAPHRIEAWSRSFGVEESAVAALAAHEREAARRGLWQGSTHLSTAFRLALTNVTAHELTHVMLRLPRDRMKRVGALREAAAQLNALYRGHPEIEEGAANFMGGLVSLEEAATLLPHAGRAGDWRTLWALHQGLVAETIGGYHTAASLAYFRAWSSTSHSLRAFAGLFNVLALDQRATDWQITMAELVEGRITLAQTTR